MGSPGLIVVVLVVVLGGGTYLLLGGRERTHARQDAVKRSRGIRVRRRPQGSISSSRARRRQKRIAVVLLVAAMASLGIAIAQFRLNRHVTPATVILVMDSSDSMNQTDVAPSRLVAAESAARAFVDQVPEGFSVGLVTFAGGVQVPVPPTTDRSAVIEKTTSLVTSAGTVIGDGLSKALDILQAAWQKDGKGPAAIVLLSDGQDTGSTVSPTVAAARSKELGVRVFTVTVGQPETGTGQGSGANAALLQQIATTTGATTFTAQTAAELTRVYQSLGSQLSTELAVTNLGAYFLVAAVILAVAAGALALLASRIPY
jgi:Ca-activated chloride channel family protein